MRPPGASHQAQAAPTDPGAPPEQLGSFCRGLSTSPQAASTSRRCSTFNHQAAETERLAEEKAALLARLSALEGERDRLQQQLQGRDYDLQFEAEAREAMAEEAAGLIESEVKAREAMAEEAAGLIEGARGEMEALRLRAEAAEAEAAAAGGVRRRNGSKAERAAHDGRREGGAGAAAGAGWGGACCALVTSATCAMDTPE